MKKMWILSTLVTIILFNSGCGSDDSKAKSFDLLGDEEKNISVVIQPGPYAQGEFGEIDLNATYKVPKNAIFLDIRNEWERTDWKQKWDNKKREDVWSNSSLALGSVGGAVYEYRDQKGNKDRFVRDEFVGDVLEISNNNKHQRLLLICNTASRTKKAAKLLSDNNFTYVEYVVGGMAAWRDVSLATATFESVKVDGDYNLSSDSLFLDIRNSWEREDGNYAKNSIEGAVYEYRDQNGEKKREVRDEFVSEVLNLCENNRTKPIILICNTSSRTKKAAKLLVESGFTNVGHIDGGLADWESSGLSMGE